MAIALLHGPQNKKASLDRWYKTYEEEFEQRSEIEQAFDAVTGELGSILPDIKSTRWRRISDFYTLFTTLADHEDDLPLTQKGAPKLASGYLHLATRSQGSSPRKRRRG